MVDRIDQTNARRAQNKSNAMALARAGIAVFPSNGKIPLIKLYNRLDSEISPDEREAVIARAHEERKGAYTIFVGATTDHGTVKRMWRYPNDDAVPSVACGPAKLVVLDADVKFNGPELIAKLFEEHGGVPEGAPVITTQSGGRHYIFSDPDNTFTNSAGQLKKLYGCDVRGRGGQFVAPGSWREDNKRYGDQAALKAFIESYKAGAIPPLPDYIVELIGKPVADSVDDIAPSVEREIIKRLEQSEIPDWEELCTPLGEYDFDKFQVENAEFKKLYDEPSANRSDNRFSAARRLMTEWSEMTDIHLASFLKSWEGAGEFVDGKPRSGEYNNRQIAREYLKNKGLIKPGESFGAVSDEDEDEQPTKKEAPYVGLTELLAEPETYTRWIVKHFIAFNTTIIAAGLWGAGKTAVYLDIALHVALGLPWHGRKVDKGIVVYVALENPHDVQSRIRAWCKRNNSVEFEDSFVLYRGNCSLFDPRDKGTRDEKRIIKLANEAAERLNLPVALVVIDTVSQAILPGSDREHGSLFVNSMLRIANATGACVTALHHPTKAGDEVRGDGAFQGNTDGVVLMSRDKKTGLGTIKAGQKFRVGDPSKVNFGYRLEPVVVGKDADGEDIPVIIAVEAADPVWTVDDGPDEGNEQEVPPAPDTPNDRPIAILRVIRERVESIAANTGDAPDRIDIATGEVLRLWNIDRQRRGLSEITDAAVCSRLLSKLVESEELLKVGENKRSTAYRLAA